MDYNPEDFRFAYPVEQLNRTHASDAYPASGYGNVDFKVYTQTGPTTQQEDVDMDGGAWMTLPTSSLTLTTLNFDVQYHIMSLLSPADLSRLMRTCSSYFEAGIVLLCSHSKIPLNTVSQVLSFAKFLRVYDPQHTRTPLIRELHFNLEEYTFTLAKGAASPNPDSSGFPSSYFALPAHHPLTEEHLMRDARNRALETFLTLLPQCAALSRLRIDRWYDDAPPSLLHHALTHLTHLTHVRMPLFARGALDLASFARLPRLRSLVLLPSRKWQEAPDALAALLPLAPTLEALELPVCGWRAPAAPFPRVHTLGIEFPHADRDLPRVLARAFPALRRLALRGARPLHLCGTARARAEDACARERAQAQWRALARDGAVWPWPDLESVAGESACALHALALPRAVRRLSVAFAASEPAAAGDAMLARVLCDARPACLEVRVTNAHFKYNPFPARFGALARMGRAHADARARERGGGDASGGDPVAADDGGGEAAMGIRRFVLSLEGDSVPDYVQVAAILLDELHGALAPLAVSHVLVRHTVAPFRAAAEHTRRIVHALRAHAAPRAAALALAAPALAWVGVLVELPAAPGAPRWLRAWRVVRPAPRRDRFAFGDARVREGEGEEKGEEEGRAGPGVVLAEVGEGEAWEELAREGMVEAGDGAAW